MTISIVTPWLGHIELAPAYEAAVTGAQVVIVDNASDPETAAALDAMVERLSNGSVVLHNETNRYFTAANNQGYDIAVTEMEAATDDVVMFVNSDIVAAEGWLEQVEREVVDGALYGPSVLAFDVDGTAYPYVEGWCVVATRGTWGRLSSTGAPWDEVNYSRCYGDDLDLSFRARLAGCSLAKATWPIRHLGNRTNADLPGAYDHADENRETFRRSVRAWRESQTT